MYLLCSKLCWHNVSMPRHHCHPPMPHRVVAHMCMAPMVPYAHAHLCTCTCTRTCTCTHTCTRAHAEWLRVPSGKRMNVGLNPTVGAVFFFQQGKLVSAMDTEQEWPYVHKNRAFMPSTFKCNTLHFMPSICTWAWGPPPRLASLKNCGDRFSVFSYMYVYIHRVCTNSLTHTG